MAAQWEEGAKRRREGAQRLVRFWAAGGALRPDLDEKMAVDIMWALLSPDLFHLLVTESGWSGAQYENWLEGELRALIGASDEKDSGQA